MEKAFIKCFNEQLQVRLTMRVHKLFKEQRLPHDMRYDEAFGEEGVDTMFSEVLDTHISLARLLAREPRGPVLLALCHCFNQVSFACNALFTAAMIAKHITHALALKDDAVVSEREFQIEVLVIFTLSFDPAAFDERLSQVRIVNSHIEATSLINLDSTIRRALDAVVMRMAPRRNGQRQFVARNELRARHRGCLMRNTHDM